MMARKINPPGQAYARERVRLGDFNAEGVWDEFTQDTAAELLGDPADWARFADFFLAIDDAEPEETVGRFKYPIARLVDGVPTMFASALVPAREEAVAASDGATVALIDDLRAQIAKKVEGVAGEVDESAGGTPSAAGGSTSASQDPGGGGNKPPIVDERGATKFAGMRHRSTPIRAEVVADSIDWDARRVDLAFSSETPVERFFGMEILDHSGKSADLSRLNSGDAALLVNHNPDDQVGVVERAWIGNDRKGRATVRFGRSARAQEILQDVVDGIRKSVSFTYEYLAAPILEREGSEKEPAVYRFMRWLGFEISIVAIPADTAVGVGRAMDMSGADARKGMAMTDESKPAITVGQTYDDGAKAERARQANIRALGRFAKVANDEIEKALGEGLTIDAWRERVDKLTSSGNASTAATPAASVDGSIGMSPKEVRQWSLFRALRSMLEPANARLRDEAKFEFEIAEEVARKRGFGGKGLLMPDDVMMRGFMGRRVQRTSLTVGTVGKGGYTVGTDMDAANFIEILQARSVVMPLATILGGLNGDVAIPRHTTAATGGWVAEGNAATEDTTLAFDQLVLQPKTVSHNIPVTRKLLLQSSIDIENFVLQHFADREALKIDSAAIKGGGSNEPSGILSGGSIGSIGAISGAVTWAEAMALIGQVAVDNAFMGDLNWITYPTVWARLKSTSKDTGSGQFINDDNNTIAGFPVHMSSQVPVNLGAGNETALIFGNMRDVIIGFWGGLDLTVDPYTNATSGTIRCVALQSCDIKLRHDESFAAAQDVTV